MPRLGPRALATNVGAGSRASSSSPRPGSAPSPRATRPGRLSPGLPGRTWARLSARGRPRPTIRTYLRARRPGCFTAPDSCFIVSTFNYQPRARSPTTKGHSAKLRRQLPLPRPRGGPLPSLGRLTLAPPEVEDKGRCARPRPAVSRLPLQLSPMVNSPPIIYPSFFVSLSLSLSLSPPPSLRTRHHHHHHHQHQQHQQYRRFLLPKYALPMAPLPLFQFRPFHY
jgi:hypothetical protein